jgi:hypothetical protein
MKNAEPTERRANAHGHLDRDQGQRQGRRARGRLARVRALDRGEPHGHQRLPGPLRKPGRAVRRRVGQQRRGRQASARRHDHRDARRRRLAPACRRLRQGGPRPAAPRGGGRSPRRARSPPRRASTPWWRWWRSHWSAAPVSPATRRARLRAGREGACVRSHLPDPTHPARSRHRRGGGRVGPLPKHGGLSTHASALVSHRVRAVGAKPSETAE